MKITQARRRRRRRCARCRAGSGRSPTPSAPAPRPRRGAGTRREHEEVLLAGLRVVHAARLAGLEHGDRVAELRERRGVTLEDARGAEGLVRHPGGLAHVDDEPAWRDGRQPGGALLEDGSSTISSGRASLREELARLLDVRLVDPDLVRAGERRARVGGPGGRSSSASRSTRCPRPAAASTASSASISFATTVARAALTSRQFQTRTSR